MAAQQGMPLDTAPGLMRKTRVVVNDKMQRGYVYYRTEPVGRNFAPSFEPELSPRQMLRLGVFGGKSHDRLPRRIPIELVRPRKAEPEAAEPKTQLLRSDRFSTARRVAPQGLDPSAGPARVVSVVLPGTAWAAVRPTMRDRSSVGAPSDVMWRRSNGIARSAISNVAGDSVRP